MSRIHFGYGLQYARRDAADYYSDESVSAMNPYPYDYHYYYSNIDKRLSQCEVVGRY